MFAIAGATLYEWLVFICNFFSVPLYLVTLYILIKHRNKEPFNGPFFKLYISAGIADLLVNVSFYNLCLRLWGWVDWQPMFYHSTLSWWFRMLPYFSWLFTISQVNGVAILAINRFCNILYLQQWSDTTVRVFVLCQWFVAAAGVAPVFFVDYTVEMVVGNGGPILHSRPPGKMYSIYVLMIGIYFSTISIIIALLYAIMFASIRRQNKVTNETSTNGNSDNNKDKANLSAEIRLAFMGFILFVLLFMYCVFLAFYAYFTKIGNKMMKHVCNILFFNQAIIQSQMNPWLLIICSKPTRKMFLKMLGVRNADGTTITVGPTSNNNRRSLKRNDTNKL